MDSTIEINTIEEYYNLQKDIITVNKIEYIKFSR